MNIPYFCNMSAAISPCSLEVLTAFSAKAQTKAQKRCLCLQYFSLEWLFVEHLYLKKDFSFHFVKYFKIKKQIFCINKFTKPIQAMQIF